MNLQDTFYVIGIVYMGIGLLLMLALVIAVFMIKAKINAIHRRIEDKFNDLTQIIQAGEKIYHSVKDMTGRK